MSDKPDRLVFVCDFCGLETDEPTRHLRVHGLSVAEYEAMTMGNRFDTIATDMRFLSVYGRRVIEVDRGWWNDGEAGDDE